MDNVICTPHLGAATEEAQENVAIQVAEQMSDYLLLALSPMPSTCRRSRRKKRRGSSRSWRLPSSLGSFAGQLTESSITGLTIEYAGHVGEHEQAALTSALLAGLFRPMLAEVNMVSAPVIARDRGIAIDETTRDARGAYDSYIRLNVKTERQQRSVAGTVFSDGKPRIIQVKGINMEAELGPHMLYITNADKPGFIGALGTHLGDAGVNIATFHLGRQNEGGDAIALVEIDEAIARTCSTG